MAQRHLQCHLHFDPCAAKDKHDNQTLYTKKRYFHWEPLKKYVRSISSTLGIPSPCTPKCIFKVPSPLNISYYCLSHQIITIYDKCPLPHCTFSYASLIVRFRRLFWVPSFQSINIFRIGPLEIIFREEFPIVNIITGFLCSSHRTMKCI